MSLVYATSIFVISKTIKIKVMKNLKNIFESFGNKSAMRTMNLSEQDLEFAYAHSHGQNHHLHGRDDHSHENKGYQCPMKCEGDKIYDAPGNCPVCNMKLVPVGNSEKHGHQQS